MLRSKRGPALFDYLTRGEDGKGSPRPARPNDRPVVETPVLPGPAAISSARDAPPTERAPVQIVDGPTDRSPPEAARGWIEVDDRHVRVSFNSLTAAATVFVLLMVLLGAFELGKRRGEQAGLLRGFEEAKAALPGGAADELEAVRQQTPSGELVRNLLREPPAANMTGTTATVPAGAGRPSEGSSRKASAERWVKGRTYIVVQEFAGDKEEPARRAQGYLASKSVPTAIVSGSAGTLRLVTTDGFNRQDASERRLSEQVLGRIHALGEEYFRDGGGYRLQGYFATFKGDSW